MKNLVVILVTAILGTATLFAHGGAAHQTLLGTVSRVRPCHLVITTPAGSTKTIFVTPETTFTRGTEVVTLKDLKSGTRVSVSIDEDGETAESVKVGGAK